MARHAAGQNEPKDRPVQPGPPGEWDRPVTCPVCKQEQDRWTQMVDDGSRPEVGDAIVCFNCGSVNMLQEDGSLVEMSENDRTMLLDETPHLKRMMDGLASKFRAERARHG